MSQFDSIQRRTTKYIFLNYLNYVERLKVYNILPVHFRRDYLDVIFTYNCIQDINDLNILTMLIYITLRLKQDNMMKIQ